MRRFAVVLLLLVVFTAYAAPDAITPPEALERVAPNLRDCNSRHLGKLEIEATISTAGTLENIRVLTPVTPCVAKAAKLALSQWKFAPATQQGKPVAVQFHFTMPAR